jgi:uncharacterized protein (TIGR02444 family)
MIIFMTLLKERKTNDLIAFADQNYFEKFALNHKLNLKNKVWDFALKLYAIKENQQLLLGLQDNENINVNDVLFAAFCDFNGMTFTNNIINNNHQEWRKRIIEPLRALRRHAKISEPSEVYSALKNIELMCEQIDIAYLHNYYRIMNTQVVALDGATNLQHYQLKLKNKRLSFVESNK